MNGDGIMAANKIKHVEALLSLPCDTTCFGTNY